MNKEEFIKQRCEIDKITEEEFKKRFRVVKCNCGQPYCKGYRCLDLDGLLRENQELKEKIKTYEDPEDLTLMFMYCDEKAKDKIRELKKQLEDKEERLERLRISAIGHAERELDLENQQKEFIKWLEDYLNLFDYRDIDEQAGYDMLEEILQKYKEIIGSDINVGSIGGKE